MAIKVNDKDGLDVMLRLDSSNRDVEIPDDILIASYSNLVDRGRKSFGNPFTTNNGVKAGVANKAHSVVEVIQKSIDDGRISLSSPFLFKIILQDANTVIKASYVGEEPTATVTGVNDEIVTINIPSACTPLSFSVIGNATYVDDDDSRTVIFEGDGVPGNTSLDYLNPPLISKIAMPTNISNPSSDNPYRYDLDSSPGYEIISVGTSGSPSLGIRFTNMAGLQNKHLLKFIW